MNKEEKLLIKHAREDMDENAISDASFRIQSILEEVFQKGIKVGETIGYANALAEQGQMAKLDEYKKEKKGSK